MTQAEIEAVLQAAFRQCLAAGFPLHERQKQILLQLAKQLAGQWDNSPASPNPLDDLTSEERRVLLRFVKEQERHDRSWKVTLFNDWLQGRTSGAVQFIRDRYGVEWLSRVEPYHLEAYEDAIGGGGVRVKVGDRLEVSNRLWEWVQGDDASTQEWFPCTVIGMYESKDGDNTYTNCLIRFENGLEYEIQGIYQWNRYNWRWSKGGQ